MNVIPDAAIVAASGPVRLMQELVRTSDERGEIMANSIRWLTTEEAADRACCGPRALRRAACNGRLQAAHIRGELRFLERWIDEWLINQLMPEDGEISVAVDAAPAGTSW